MGRAYVHVDKEALRARLLDRASGITVLRGAVVATEATEAGTSARDDRGRVHEASVVILATGASVATCWQTAHGLFAEVEGLDPEMPLWMDFSHDPSDGIDVPTFLYALPFPDGNWLLEETALARSPAVSHDVLERRLRERLAAMGARLRSVVATERVTIPMDAPIPAAGLALRFGAAGGMIHPATGYLLPRALAAAPRVAEALAAALPGGPASALRAAHEALWPAEAARRNRILRYGGGALAALGTADTRTFLEAFFASDPTFVAGFLGDRLPLGGLVRGMADLFRRLPARLRLRVLSAGDPSELLRAMSAPLPRPEALR
jgi:lycopene beta-cyclase